MVTCDLSSVLFMKPYALLHVVSWHRTKRYAYLTDNACSVCGGVGVLSVWVVCVLVYWPDFPIGKVIQMNWCLGTLSESLLRPSALVPKTCRVRCRIGLWSLAKWKSFDSRPNISFTIFKMGTAKPWVVCWQSNLDSKKHKRVALCFEFWKVLSYNFN